MSDEEDISRGQRAQAMLADPMVKGAFDAIEAEYVRQWRSSKATVDQRESAWLGLQNLDLLRASFMTHITTGKIAADRAEKHNRKKGSESP